MLDEGLALMQRLFTETSVTHEGKYYACRDIEMFPKPKQNPFPALDRRAQHRECERCRPHRQRWLPGWRPWLNSPSGSSS